MHKPATTGKAAICALAAAAYLLPTAAGAQDAASVAGTYCLAGVREVGSCLRLSADGTFEYFLAYGAYDESSEGTWRLEGGEVVLDSPAYDRPPTFTFKRLQAGVAGGFDVVVVSKRDREIAGINVRVTCDGRTREAGVTGAGGYKIDCATAPAAVALGLHMYGLAYQTIDVASRAGADKVYVFEFDPGDLGRKRFAAHRLRIEGGGLSMVYADTPIRELAGRSFAYMRN